MFHNNTVATTKERKGLSKMFKKIALYIGFALGSFINIYASDRCNFNIFSFNDKQNKIQNNEQQHKKQSTI